MASLQIWQTNKCFTSSNQAATTMAEWLQCVGSHVEDVYVSCFLDWLVSQPWCVLILLQPDQICNVN